METNELNLPMTILCIHCTKPITEWEFSYLDEVGMPKYYIETKTKQHVERYPLCGPQCSLEYQEKIKGNKNEN